MMNNDLECLDNYLLEKNDEIKTLFIYLWKMSVDYEVEPCIKKYIKRSIEWWKNEYLPSIKSKDLIYLSFIVMDEFIKISSKEIVSEVKTLLEE